MAKTSIFCTGTLDLSGSAAASCMKKRSPAQRVHGGIRLGKRAAARGSLCSATHTHRHHSAAADDRQASRQAGLSRRHGVEEGHHAAACRSRRQAHILRAAMRRIWACQPKGALVMEACTICSSATTWGVKIGAGHMSIASHTPHPGKLTCRSSRK